MLASEAELWVVVGSAGVTVRGLGSPVLAVSARVGDGDGATVIVGRFLAVSFIVCRPDLYRKSVGRVIVKDAVAGWKTKVTVCARDTAFPCVSAAVLPKNDACVCGAARGERGRLRCALVYTHETFTKGRSISSRSTESGPACPQSSRVHRRSVRPLGWGIWGVRLAPDETVILLRPPLPLVGVSIGVERGCQ